MIRSIWSLCRISIASSEKKTGGISSFRCWNLGTLGDEERKWFRGAAARLNPKEDLGSPWPVPLRIGWSWDMPELTSNFAVPFLKKPHVCLDILFREFVDLDAILNMLV